MKNFISKYKKVFLLFFFTIFICFWEFFVSYASSFFFESFISTNSKVLEFTGTNAGGQFGSTIASGDLNGDGIDDLIIGAPFFSREDSNWVGAVFVVFGKSDFRDKSLDFSKIIPDITFIGKNKGDQFGSSITSGDYNNDGIDDLVIGAYNAYINEDDRAGNAYLFYGSNLWTNPLIDLLEEDADLEFNGTLPGDNFGLELFTSDINTDGIDDLLIGAPSAYGEAQKSGAAYGIFGSSEGLNREFNVAFLGPVSDGRFGSTICAGDVNGDGKNDLAIGAYLSSHNEIYQSGKVYIYSGIENFLSPITDYTLIIGGKLESGWFGFDIAINDVNNDGNDDLAITSFPYMGDREAGKVDIFYGKKLFGVFSSYPDLTIQDPVSQALLGSSVLLEDFDLDERADIFVGAPGVGYPVSSDSGDVYGVYSSYIADFVKFSAEDKSVTSIIHGENSDDWFGYTLDGLDINGDGYRDLAVGSRYSDSVAIDTGKVFILLGNGKPFGTKSQTITRNDYLTRGEFISLVIDRFDLKSKKSSLINKCYIHKNFCLFTFMAMSSYDDIQLEPDIILYPDVPPSDRYYEDILVGTILGLINGYLTDEDSPFYPDKYISRIQGLKIVLSASELVPSLSHFELVNELGSVEKIKNQNSYFSDVDPSISYMWWYPRYVNFAVENDIIDDGTFFRPDDYLTEDELDDFIDRTLEFISLNNEETSS